MESQPQNPEFRNNPKKLSPMDLGHYLGLNCKDYQQNDISR